MTSSFYQILKDARSKNKSNITEDSVIEEKNIEKNIDEEQNIIIQNEVSDKNLEDDDKNVVKNESFDYIYLGDLIVSSAKEALLKSKNFKVINSAKRLSKKLASGQITSNELIKCFKLQQRFPKPQNWNNKLVGGEAMMELKLLLDKGVDLNTALNTKKGNK